MKDELDSSPEIRPYDNSNKQSKGRFVDYKIRIEELTRMLKVNFILISRIATQNLYQQ